MSESIKINKNRSALLIMDFENDIIARFVKNPAELLDRTANLIKGAREAGVPVIYLVVRFRAGYPEINPDLNIRVLKGIRASGILLEGTTGSEIAAQVAPLPGEPVVVKKRSGAFSNTELATLLKARDVNCLILAGIATSGVVLSTVRWAADADYEQIVVEDCCADGDEEVHRVLTGKVFPTHATVAQAQEVLAALQG
ncbi:MAG: cysteine hydrolase [Chloroflexi bacterium]|nr:cysteine hydrolase [Chloroflexota bacterium]OJW00690.1 MAG: hydrolase [Chloroflexi bacterium 54-19]